MSTSGHELASASDKRGITGKVLIAMYLGAIVLANTAVARFGPAALPFTAFLLIGLDLSSRDGLHELWRGQNLWPKMALLVGSGSALTWVFNMDHPRIALASFAAFAAAGIADTAVYALFGTRIARMFRVNGSNVVSGGVDAWLFPFIAWGIANPLLGITQFIMKVGGGFFWSLIFRKTIWRSKPAPAASYAPATGGD